MTDIPIVEEITEMRADRGRIYDVAGDGVDDLLARSASLLKECVEALEHIASGASLGRELFEKRVRERKDRLTWFAVNVLQHNLDACKGTADATLAKVRP